MSCVQYIWWTPLAYLLIPQHLNLHVILNVRKDADGELRFTSQEDHIFWVESLLGSNPILTLGLGPLFMRYIRPVAGELAAMPNPAICLDIELNLCQHMQDPADTTSRLNPVALSSLGMPKIYTHPKQHSLIALLTAAAAKLDHACMSF